MPKQDTLIGVTPITIKRAAYYLSLGQGEYYPDHPHYDKVVVDKTYDIMQSPVNEFEWSVGLCVSFYKENHKVLWIEFGCRTVGAGGDTIIKEVK
jgi:hypothetical protein